MALPPDLEPGQSIDKIIRELWAFYQFSMQDEDTQRKFENFKLYKMLKEENDRTR